MKCASLKKSLMLVGFSVFGAVLVMGMAGSVLAACTRIQDGTLTYSAGLYLAGQPLTTGYDSYGYNYQAHMFSGSFFNAYANRGGFPAYTGDDASYLTANPGAASHWAWPYRSISLTMKWNDAWLSNKDCDADGLLDRHYGSPTYKGSGAWETNHQADESTWLNAALKEVTSTWTYFVKIVAVPSDAYKVGTMWYSSDGIEIGLDIWGEFAIVQEVWNDPLAAVHGKQYVSPYSPGFGVYAP